MAVFYPKCSLDSRVIRNVFIIDEPELSLHVQWQEKFVDGIMEASRETQFILATHSPTIILDKVLNCVEISRR